MRKLYRWLVPLAIGGTAFFGATAAHGAMPANQGCVGSTVKVLAQGTNHFHLAKNLAQNETKGLGAEVQAVQSGTVSDAVLPNTCND